MSKTAVMLVAGLAAMVGILMLMEFRSPYEKLGDELFFAVAGQDTQFAVGYSDEAFASIVVGDTEASALAALGEPLSRSEYEGRSYLAYSRSPTSTHFRRRSLTIENDVVTKITAEPYFD